MPIKIQVVNWL